MNKGDLLSILCSLSVACHMVAIERLGREVDPIASTIIQFAVTTLCFVALTGVFESYHLALTPKLWKALAYLVIVTTVIAFTIQNMAQRHLSSTSTALILTLETAFGGVFAVLYLREHLTLEDAPGLRRDLRRHPHRGDPVALPAQGLTSAPRSAARMAWPMRSMV